MSQAGNITVNKVDGLHIKVKMSGGLRLRVWLSTKLFNLGAWVLGATFEVED
jgi:hypothetical protein